MGERTKQSSPEKNVTAILLMSPLGPWKKLMLMKFAAVIKLGDIMNTRKEEKE